MSEEAPANELRILVFGQSNSSGEHLADPGQAWPRMVAAELAARLCRPVALTMRPIFVHAPGLESYLDRILAKDRPDIVLFGATAFAFSQRMVVVSVRRRFGERAANTYQWLETRVDRRTRQSELGSRANRIARRTMVRLLGAETITSYEAVMDGTEAALKRLAREEIPLTIFQGNRMTNTTTASDVEVLMQFDADIQRIANQLHIGYLDMRPPLDNALDQATLSFPDRLHLTAHAHRLLADCALRAFEDGTIRLPE